MARKDRVEQKLLDVDASMQGTLTFKDPVNLRINGSFEGKLDTKGSLIIGENATVQADIIGEEIVVGGKVTGNIRAQKQLQMLSRAHVVGDITTPVLIIESGAVMQGKCEMMGRYSEQRSNAFNADQLAKYLEVEVSNILSWANSGKIPAFKEGDDWRFDRGMIDEWIAKERAK
ncbi:MAG: polymer-forming cytoskeletal protein [Candidatus Omnitrophica bacterium]|nr:polymer-forming cytoskeletal protein [Candidatus Omnitrophota bacterium]MBU1933329.1 polymer-forming cytoskeletal protein [Candidatus Omnitrophota bacterium]